MYEIGQAEYMYVARYNIIGVIYLLIPKHPRMFVKQKSS